jgi:hypothetical protein
MSYSTLSKKDLALKLAEVMEISPETAERFVGRTSGEARAIELLEDHDRNRKLQVEMTRSRQRLQAAVLR